MPRFPIASLSLSCLLPLSAVAQSVAIEEVLKTTFKITNKSSTATCFFVSGDKGALVLVTAAHVLENMSGNEARIVLRRKQPDGAYARHEVPVRVRSDENKPLWTRHPTLDVAAMPVELAADAPVAPFSLDQIAGPAAKPSGRQPIRIAQTVWIPGYPAQLEANSAGFPVVRRGSVASHPLPSDTNILIDFSTFGGDSGAPVLRVSRNGNAKGKPVVVAIVIGLNRQTDKTVMPFEERTVHTPLGLANAIPARFIRETIAKIPKS